MKIRIELDENIDDNEVIIRCREIDKSIEQIQTAISQISKKGNFVFYKEHTEYYFPLSTIIFFETSENITYAHTINDIFITKNKLYELEDMLPNSFIRISKSTIVNVDHVYSIDRNLTSSSCISLDKTHKKVYVSRSYYKLFKSRLDERRNYEN